MPAPELTAAERIQPCLFDRLIDEAPHEPLESRLQRVMTLSAYRESVRRDLSNLLNTHAHFPDGVSATYPQAAASVLNYGMRDLCGLCLSTLEIAEVERHLAQVIRTFESRLIPHTVQVKLVVTEATRRTPTVVGFEVSGDLWARPLPLPWFVKTEIDLESGVTAVRH